MFKFLVLTLGIISCQAYAEDTVIENDHDISAIKDCWQKNSDDDTDINVIKSCLLQEYNLVDAQLNKAYGEAYRYIEQVPRTGVKKPDTEQLNLLKKSQRAWLDFRDKECELILSNEDVQDLMYIVPRRFDNGIILCHFYRFGFGRRFLFASAYPPGQPEQSGSEQQKYQVRHSRHQAE